MPYIMINRFANPFFSRLYKFCQNLFLHTLVIQMRVRLVMALVIMVNLADYDRMCSFINIASSHFHSFLYI